jgi:hypothetical protein
MVYSFCLRLNDQEKKEIVKFKKPITTGKKRNRSKNYSIQRKKNSKH